MKGIHFDLRLEAAAGKFRFLIWDAEWSMAPGWQSQVKIRNDQPIAFPALGVGAAYVHDKLVDHPAYQLAFQARMSLHFGAGGLMGRVTEWLCVFSFASNRLNRKIVGKFDKNWHSTC